MAKLHSNPPPVSRVALFTGSVRVSPSKVDHRISKILGDFSMAKPFIESKTCIGISAPQQQTYVHTGKNNSINKHRNNSFLQVNTGLQQQQMIQSVSSRHSYSNFKSNSNSKSILKSKSEQQQLHGIIQHQSLKKFITTSDDRNNNSLNKLADYIKTHHKTTKNMKRNCAVSDILLKDLELSDSESDDDTKNKKTMSLKNTINQIPTAAATTTTNSTFIKDQNNKSKNFAYNISNKTTHESINNNKTNNIMKATVQGANSSVSDVLLKDLEHSRTLNSDEDIKNKITESTHNTININLTPSLSNFANPPQLTHVQNNNDEVKFGKSSLTKANYDDLFHYDKSNNGEAKPLNTQKNRNDFIHFDLSSSSSDEFHLDQQEPQKQQQKQTSSVTIKSKKRRRKSNNIPADSSDDEDERDNIVNIKKKLKLVSKEKEREQNRLRESATLKNNSSVLSSTSKKLVPKTVTADERTSFEYYLNDLFDYTKSNHSTICICSKKPLTTFENIDPRDIVNTDLSSSSSDEYELQQQSQPQQLRFQKRGLHKSPLATIEKQRSSIISKSFLSSSSSDDDEDLSDRSKFDKNKCDTLNKIFLSVGCVKKPQVLCSIDLNRLTKIYCNQQTPQNLKDLRV